MNVKVNGQMFVYLCKAQKFAYGPLWNGYFIFLSLTLLVLTPPHISRTLLNSVNCFIRFQLFDASFIPLQSVEVWCVFECTVYIANCKWNTIDFSEYVCVFGNTVCSTWKRYVIITYVADANIHTLNGITEYTEVMRTFLLPVPSFDKLDNGIKCIH